MFSIKRLFMLVILLLILFGTSAVYAQTSPTTIPISDTSRPTWNPSPDDGLTFGTPPAPLVTSYRGEFYVKSKVSNGLPTGTVDLTVDFGKPTVDATNMQTGPLLKPVIAAGTEYFLYLRTVGPGGVSAQSAGIGPFGFPSIPRAAGTFRGITP